MQEIINNPENNWVHLLKKDSKVWLVKEKKEAFVSDKYKNCWMGSFVNKFGNLGLIIDNCKVFWYMDSNGKGFDGSLLMLPMEGSLLTEEEYEEECEKEDLKLLKLMHGFKGE